THSIAGLSQQRDHFSRSQTALAAETGVVVMCNGGTRSLFAAEDLRRLGYAEVLSVSGGFNQWKSEGSLSKSRRCWISICVSAIPDICACRKWARRAN